MNSFATAPAAPDAADGRLEAVHLGDMTRLLSGRWRLLAGAGIAAFAASVLFVTLVPPRYTGEAKLILESRDSFYTRPTQDRGEQQPLIDEQAVASQVQVVMSRDLARDAIKQLGLVGNEELDPLAGEISLVRRLMILTGLTKNPLDRPPEDRVLENITSASWSIRSENRASSRSSFAPRIRSLPRKVRTPSPSSTLPCRRPRRRTWPATRRAGSAPTSTGFGSGSARPRRRSRSIAARSGSSSAPTMSASMRSS